MVFLKPEAPFLNETQNFFNNLDEIFSKVFLNIKIFWNSRFMGNCE